MNEGLAEYALVRTTELLAADPGYAYAAAARQVAREHRERLNHLMDREDVSIRLRFYETGPAQAAVLDRLAGPGWQTRLVEENLTLQDLLADVAGYRDPERRLIARAAERADLVALRSRTSERIEALRTRRRQRVDSLLARSGLKIEITAEALSGGFGHCRIDPQNVLQIDTGVLLHTRMLRPCAGNALVAQFTTPVLDDQRAGMLTAVVGPETDVRLTIAGEPTVLDDGERLEAAEEIRIESESLTLRSARADLERRGRVLRIRPLPK